LNIEMIIEEPEYNPLFTAIYVGNLTIVKILIFRGIDYKISYTGDYMNNMDAEAFALERREKQIASYLNSLKHKD
ncbi:ankyrin repeat domain-containing protein, partial [Acinetobacter baumannii]